MVLEDTKSSVARGRQMKWPGQLGDWQWGLGRNKAIGWQLLADESGFWLHLGSMSSEKWQGLWGEASTMGSAEEGQGQRVEERQGRNQSDGRKSREIDGKEERNYAMAGYIGKCTAAANFKLTRGQSEDH